MVCVLRVLLILLSIAHTSDVYANVQGPCVRKLLATGDQAQDTIQFTMYLEMLLDERVLVTSDLDPFIKKLFENNIINPIPNMDTAKFSVHHTEFQKLVDSNSLDIEHIKKWVNEYVTKNKKTELEKKNTEKESKALPVYVSKNGAMFYKINHPKLGEALRILKPNGRVENEQDWEETIWSISPLVNKKNELREIDIYGYLDSTDKTLVSKNTKGRKACLSLGDGVDLPTKDEFVRLMEYFGHFRKRGSLYLTRDGKKDFHNVLPDSMGSFWSSTVYHDEDFKNQAWRFDLDDGRYYSDERDYPLFIRCIARGLK